MEPASILFCIDSLDYGGTEKQLVRLIERLDRRRFLPFLCTLRESVLEPSEVAYGSLRLRVGSLAAPSVIPNVLTLRRFIRQHRIEIVQTFFQDSAIVALLATRGLRPCVLLGSVRDLGFWRTPLKTLQMRWAYRSFDGFIANSKAVAEHHHRVDGIPWARLRVIYNGVEQPGTTVVDPSMKALRRQGKVVGIVANLNREVKRVDLFLDAASRVRAKQPAVRFVVVGDGHLRPTLEAHAERLGIMAAVHFTGKVADPRPIVAGFDVGVICSDSEGFSNAILEYMIAGVPTIATAVGGNEELIAHGETGLLSRPGDSEGLAAKTLRLLEDDALRGKLGASARRVAVERYSLTRYVAEHESLYLAMMERC